MFHLYVSFYSVEIYTEIFMQRKVNEILLHWWREHWHDNEAI